MPCACDDPTVAGVPGGARMGVATAWKVVSVVPETVREVPWAGQVVGQRHREQKWGAVLRWWEGSRCLGQ